MQAADVLHLTRGRESEAFKHPYMALLRQYLLDFLPRPASASQQAAAGSPSKGRRASPAPLPASCPAQLPASCVQGGIHHAY